VIHSLTIAIRSNLLTCLVPPASDSGSTSVCPWLWSDGTPRVFWPVCSFDFGCPQRADRYWYPPLAFISTHNSCFPNICAFCKFYCPHA